MKKIIVILIILFIPIYVYAGDEIINVVKVNYPIFINGAKMQSSLPVLNFNGSTYIPLRKVTEEMGYKVDWDSEKRTINLNDQSSEKIILEDFKECIPDEITINDLKYSIDTVLFINNQPSGDMFNIMFVDGVTIHLTEDKGKSFSNNIKVKKAWVDNDGNMIEITFTEGDSIITESSGLKKYRIHSYSQLFRDIMDSEYNEKLVDVYVKIYDEANNKYYIIKAVDQKVTVVE